MLTITDAEAFLDIVEHRSLASAARSRGVAATTLGRAVERLEFELGVRLLHRSTRSVAPTAAGEAFALHARTLLHDVRALTDAMSGFTLSPTGLLRVSACTAYARSRLSPAFAAFAQAHPAARLDLVLETRWLDLDREGVDVAIRSGEPPKRTSSVATRIATHGYRVVTTRDYLRGRSVRDPDELSRHAIVTLRTSERHTTWPFERNGERRVVVATPAIETTDIAMALQLVRAGAGIAAFPDYLVEEALAARELVPLLERWELPVTPVVAMHAPRKSMSALGRALLAHLTA